MRLSLMTETTCSGREFQIFTVAEVAPVRFEVGINIFATSRSVHCLPKGSKDILVIALELCRLMITVFLTLKSTMILSVRLMELGILIVMRLASWSKFAFSDGTAIQNEARRSWRSRIAQVLESVWSCSGVVVRGTKILNTRGARATILANAG